MLYVAIGVTANLALLGYFKYANFFVANWNALGAPVTNFQRIVLPITLSFFTLPADGLSRPRPIGKTGDYDFSHYALLVTFFPHLIAGPIVHYREMLTQFTRPNIGRSVELLRWV